MKKHTINFLKNTAKDYDMSFEAVKRIYENYPIEQFYQQLEAYIKDRANS